MWNNGVRKGIINPYIYIALYSLIQWSKAQMLELE